MNVLLFSWETLSTMSKIYWIIAVPSTIIFLIFLILSFLGLDADGDVDFDGGADVSGGVGGFLINFKSILSFIMMFGWAGIISTSFGIKINLTIIISIVTGLIGLFAVAVLLYFVSKLSYSGTMKIENSIGKIGTVVLRIPGKKQGKGQIQVTVQGSLRTLDAMTEEKTTLKSGSKVQVIDVQENILIVIPKI